MVRVFYGNEPYLIDKNILEQKEKYGEMNFHKFDGFCEEAITMARQVSFFSNQQVIVVYTEGLDYEPFWRYMKKPTASTIFFVVTEKMDKRTKIFKTLKENGVLMECSKLGQAEFKKYVISYLGKRNKRIAEDVYGFLVHYSGYFEDEAVTMYSIDFALKQICMQEKREVEKEDITTFFEEGETAKVFGITNALIQGEEKELFELLGKLIKQGENSIGIMSLLQRNFRLAYKASLFSKKGIDEISKMLGVPSYQFKDYLKYSPKQVDMVLKYLSSGIQAIKDGRADTQISLIITMEKCKECLKAV